MSIVNFKKTRLMDVELGEMLLLLKSRIGAGVGIGNFHGMTEVERKRLLQDMLATICASKQAILDIANVTPVSVNLDESKVMR